MALIDCGECQGKVSSMAESCPSCGFPISMRSEYRSEYQNSNYPEDYVKTIQETSKALKLQLLISGLFIVAGICLFFMQYQNKNIPVTLVPKALLAMGFSWYWITRIRIWWNHK